MVDLVQDPNDPNVWIILQAPKAQAKFKPWSGFSRSFGALADALRNMDGKGFEASTGVSAEGDSLTLHIEAEGGKVFNTTITHNGGGETLANMYTSGTPKSSGSGPDAESALSANLLNWLRGNTKLAADDFSALMEAASKAHEAGVEAPKPDEQPKPASPGKPPM